MYYEMNLKDDRSEIVAYNFAGYPAYIQKRYLSMYADYAAVSHWHDDVEFIKILSGYMLYNVNGNVLRLNEGEGIFVNSRQLHYGFSDTHTECEFLCLRLSPLLLCATESMEQEYVLPILSNASAAYVLFCQTTEWEKNILDCLSEMYSCLNQPSCHLQIQQYFYRIWDGLYCHVPRHTKLQPASTGQLTALKNMIGYIQKHYKQKISLKDIAGAGSVCVSKCCSIFQSYLSQTPIGYLTDYRLKKSIDLMTSTDMNITKISMETGFSGASYYTEIFHKHLGYTPTEYRKKISVKEPLLDPYNIHSN